MKDVVMDFYKFLEANFLTLLQGYFAVLLIFCVVVFIPFGRKKQSESKLDAPEVEPEPIKEPKA